MVITDGGAAPNMVPQRAATVYRNPYIGKWRIIEMEMWDQEFIDMETEGYFLFEKGRSGSFQFGWFKGKSITI